MSAWGTACWSAYFCRSFLSKVCLGVCWCLFRLSSSVFSCQCFSGFNQCLSEVFSSVLYQTCLKESLDVFLDQPNIFLVCVCLMGLVSDCLNWFSSFLSANVCYEEPTDVSLDWTRVFSCQYLLVSSIGVCLKCFPMSYAKSVWRDYLMSSWISPISFLPVSVSFCQCLLWGTCWCLSGLNSRVFLPVSFSEFNQCLPEVFPNVFCQVCLKGSLDVFLV